jgi:hypothetical protein
MDNWTVAQHQLLGLETTPHAPRSQRILGLAAGDFFRVSAPLIGGLLSGTAFMLALGGKERMAQLFLASWGLVTAFGGAAIALQEVEDRRTREQSTG